MGVGAGGARGSLGRPAAPRGSAPLRLCDSALNSARSTPDAANFSGEESQTQRRKGAMERKEMYFSVEL